MIAALAFTIPGPPRPWERAGTMARYDAKKKKIVTIHFTPTKTRRYKLHVKTCAMAAAVNAGWIAERGGKYAIRLRCFFPDARGRDLDNLCKSVWDASKGILWGDDSQINELHIYSEIDRVQPRVEVEVRRRTGE